MLILGQEALKQAGLLPTITNLTIEGKTASIVLQINSLINRKSLSLIQDKSLQQILRFKIVFSYNKKYTNLLKKHDIEIQRATPQSGPFFILDETLTLDGSVTQVQIGTEKYFSDTITRRFQFGDLDMNHLTVFVGVYIDNAKMAAKFNLSPATMGTNIFSVFSYEDFVEDGKIINNKLQKADILIDITNQNLVNKSVEITKEISRISSVQNIHNDSSVLFSELLSTYNKQSQASFMFLTNVREIFIRNSLFKNLFTNEIFVADYFKTRKNSRPKIVKLNRYDDLGNMVVLMNTTYLTAEDEAVRLGSTKALLEELPTDPRQLCLFFTDKSSKSLKKKYTYEVIFEFEDRTIDYIQQIQTQLETNATQLTKIINIAMYGNFYNNQLKRLDVRFFEHLLQNRLSLETVVVQFVTIVKKLIVDPISNINELYSMIMNKNVTIEILQLLQNAYYFLLLETTRLKSESLSRASTKIVVSKHFSDVIDYDRDVQISADIFTYTSSGIQRITPIQFNQRVLLETLKYYKNQNVQVNEKFSYLSPLKLTNGNEKSLDLLTQKTSALNYQNNNSFLVDFMFHLLNKETNATETQKLQYIFESKGLAVFFKQHSQETIPNSTNLNVKNINIQPDSVDVLDKMFDLAFSVLLSSFVFKNDLNFLYYLNPNSSNSKINEELIENLPLQLKAAYDGMMNNSFVNLLLTNETIADVLKWVTYFIQFRCIYKLEYLEFNPSLSLRWKTLKILPTKSTICRWVPYTNSNLDIYENQTLNFKLNNDIFLFQV